MIVEVKRKTLLGKFLLWRAKNMNDQQYMMLLSVIVGLSTGVAAVIIKNAVHFTQRILKSGVPENYSNFLYFAYPSIGVFLVLLFVKYFVKNKIFHGIPNVLYSISSTKGKIKKHNMYSSIIGGALTVGFGGSVGLEGPTIATGSAIGSNIGELFRLNYKQTTLLIGCACTGALAAIFKAPIAGIIFTIEILMLDLTFASLIPLLIASVCGALTSYLILGQDVIYSFELKETFKFVDLPFYVLLGIIAGFLSLYFTKTYLYIAKIFENIKSKYKRLLIGGTLLGILIYVLPPLYGEGYEIVNNTLQGGISDLFYNSIFYDYRNNVVAVFLIILSIILLKVIATALTFGSGGIGGIFAPTLFMGALFGLLFAKTINHFEIFNVCESNFALAGMAALISGIMYAPLTAIFLIAEITGGYELFLPLMIVSVISFATIKSFEANSVYTHILAKKNKLITHDKDKAVLSILKITRLIETDFTHVDSNDSLGDLVKVISKTKRNVFPVLSEDGALQGIVTLDDIREIMFKPKLYDKLFVSDLMYVPTIVIEYEESMEDVAQKFHESGKYNIAVIKEGKYAGFVSRANLFSSYRRLLKHFSED